MPREPDWRRCARNARARPSVRLAVPMVEARGGARRATAERERGGERHETMRRPVEGGEDGGDDRRSELAAVPLAMPFGPHRLGHTAVGRLRACAGPRARARPSIGLPLSLAAVGARFRAGVECRRARNSAGGPVHDRDRGARDLSEGHGGLGEHSVRHLPLRGHALLRPHPQGRLYVRDERARERLSRGAGP